MTCELKNRDELISKYLSGELSESESSEFELHYFQCKDCFNDLKLSEDAINLIKLKGSSLTDEDTISHRNPDFFFSKLFTPARIGIAFGLVILAIITFLILQPDADKQKVIVDKTTIEAEDTTTQKEENIQLEEKVVEETIAELTGPNFKPNAYYEEWITDNIRSTSNMITEVFSPKSSEKFNRTEIIFRWTMSEKKNIILKMLNNHEKEIFSVTPDDSKFPEYSVNLRIGTIKESGLYYWRLEDENEVLYLNKFYFINK